MAWRPLVNVSVNLYDEDTFGDEHLATTVTDWNGDWSFSVNNDDGFLQDGRFAPRWLYSRVPIAIGGKHGLGRGE